MSSGSEIPLIAAAAAASSTINAIKAFGVIVRVDANDFTSILRKEEAPLVVVSGSFFGRSKFICSYKGLTFFCKAKSNHSVEFPTDTEIINSSSISMPYL